MNSTSMTMTYKYHIPLALTWFRVAVLPVIVISYYVDFAYSNWICASLFCLAGISDWLDGFLARFWSVTSVFGAFMDPIADKLVIVGSLVLIVVQMQSMLVTIAAIVIISREIYVMALRQWLAEKNQLEAAKVSFLGKLKTFIQFVAIVLLFINTAVWGVNVALIGEWVLLISAILSIISVWNYSQIFFE